MNNRTGDRSNDFLIGAVSRNMQKGIASLWLLADVAESRSPRRLPDGPGIAEVCPLPRRWVESLHEDAERWDGLA